MPALPAASKVIRCALTHTCGSDQDLVTRFFMQYAGTAPTNAQLATFAAAIGTAWGSDIKATVDVDTELTLVDCIDLSSSSAAQGSAAPGITGTRGGTALPAATCAVMSYEIARRYRGGHPRGYWRMGTVSDVDTVQSWGPSTVAAWATDLQTFMTAVEGAGWASAGTINQVNVSYYDGFTVYNPGGGRRARNVPTLRATPVIDVVTSIVGRPAFGSQRRRNHP